MIYWWTGQPGHGKTLHAIDQAIDFRDQGRLVYVCNVRGFDYDKARMLPFTPEQFRDWPNQLPEGAVLLVDECYQHDMLAKRAPGSKVPEHVKALAVHRHTGRDFIFVSQSPAKQVDEFVHDLIERQTHVRRRFGLPFAHLRIFDRFERNPEKAHPLILKRVKLPKRPRGLYESTVLDTSEKKIPWYYFAFFALLIAVPAWAWHAIGSVKDNLQGKVETPPGMVAGQGGLATREDGASATAERGAKDAKPAARALREDDYLAWLTPRVPGQPWTAPAYDKLTVPMQAPRIFCASTGAGEDADGHHRPPSCSCVTEQGTRYSLPDNHCRMLAREGQYEPFRDEVIGDRRRLDSETQRRQLYERDAARTAGPSTFEPGSVITGDQMAGYGDIAVGTAP